MFGTRTKIIWEEQLVDPLAEHGLGMSVLIVWRL